MAGAARGRRGRGTGASGGRGYSGRGTGRGGLAVQRRAIGDNWEEELTEEEYNRRKDKGESFNVD